MTDFLIVEDQPESAILYQETLDEENVSEQISYVTNARDAIRHIESPTPPNKYLVDINLGVGMEYDGIKVLESIKAKCPQSLVIVYSVYDVEVRCRKIGLPNLEIFNKDPDTNAEDFSYFKRRSREFNQQLEKAPMPESFFGQIAHVVRDGDRSWIKLVFLVDGEPVEKIVPFRPIWLAMGRTITVNEWVKLTIKEEENSVRYIYERSEDPNPYRQRFIGMDKKTFMSSKFWKQSDL